MTTQREYILENLQQPKEETMTKINDNALDLLKKRYFLTGESSWEQLCRRVAKNIASAEREVYRMQTEEQYYNMMVNLDFLPSTPCLLNAGTNTQQLSSCFILDIEDSIEGIMSTLTECAKIFQLSGGCGFNISALRPKGAPLNSSGGQASGPVSFMRLFNQLVEEVKHGNARKGAIKIDLDVSHPDIFEFIHSKDDTTQLQNMNISVSITDDFMNAVKDDKTWELHHNGKRHKVVRAKELWDEIIASAWSTGEPGVSFRDTMNRRNMNPHLGEIKGSNPCLHKDTYMVTENGLEKISNLKSRIWNGEQYAPSKAWVTGVKPTVRLMTNSGFEYVVTPDHKMLLSTGEWVEAQHTLGKKLMFDAQETEWVGFDPYPSLDYEILGFEFGDGSYHKASKRMEYIHLTPDKDIEVQQKLEMAFNSRAYPPERTQRGLVINIPNNTIYSSAFSDSLPNRMVPDWILQLPKNKMRDFLRGLFSANGTNLHSYRKIQLVSANKAMLKQVQHMLLLFGIKGKLWYHSKKQDIEFANGTCTCKQSAHIVISRKSYVKFLNTIGFLQGYKNGYIGADYQEESDESVILVSDNGEHEVWDFTEPLLHRGVTGGAYVHNCQEFVNVAYSSCNLGSINLANCTYEKDGKHLVNWARVSVLTELGVRFIDHMISANKLPLPKIQEVTDMMRPVGLGTMGLADLMFKLRIPMNTPEGLVFIDELYARIREWAEDASRTIAELMGTYPAWEGSVWHKKGKKMRNSNILSIAPNGSIGFIAGVNGGIEPVFALVYTRRTQDGHEYFVVNDIFKEELAKAGLLTDELLRKVSDNRGSARGIDEIPKWMQEVFVTASDMTPMEHLECLDAVSEHVDLSVSKTINMPHTATKEEVAQVYTSAWRMGTIKGVTVYRDGSRQLQVLTTGSKTPEVAPAPAVQRGITKDAPAISHESRTVKLNTGCGSMYLTTTKDDTGDIDQTFVSRGSQGTCLSNQTAVSRLISLALRSGVSTTSIVDQLRSVPVCPAYYGRRCKGQSVSPGSSCPSAIAHELEKYAKVQLPVKKAQDEVPQNATKNNATCPTCGGAILTVEGCVSCPACGWSKCN